MIVDANMLAEFLADPIKDDGAPIHDWIERGWGSLVYSTGGQYGTELNRSPNLKRKLEEYARRGRARVIPADEFVQDEHALARSPDLQSDDPHVLALARASRARLLYTGDKDLIADFTNKALIDDPRGKVYSRASNKSLLTRTVCQPPTPTRN